MSEQPKVSVIVPVYNAEKYLNSTIADITGQTLKDIEIIFVDDGSTDSSWDILTEWAGKDDRIMILKQQNQYAGVARNNGIEHANGEYLVFWDADDMFKAETLEHMYSKASELDADICLCGAQRYDADTEEIISTNTYLKKHLLPENNPFNKNDIPENIFTIATNVPWNKMFRKSFVDKHELRFQAIKQANDTYFSMMSMFLAESITYVPEILVTYRVNNASSISGKASDTIFCAYESYVYTLERMKNYPEFDAVRVAFANRALSGMFRSLNIQSNFESYSKVYDMIVSKGFETLGINALTEEEFLFPWQFEDYTKMNEYSAGDFLLWKSLERKNGRELLKTEIKNLKKEIKSINAVLEGTLNGKTYKIGSVFMWLPKKLAGNKKK